MASDEDEVLDPELGTFASEQHFRHWVRRSMLAQNEQLAELQEQIATLPDIFERFFKKMADLTQAESDLATSVNNLVTQDKGLQAQVATLQSQLAAGNVAAATETANAIEAVVAQINAQVVPLVAPPANGPVVGPAKLTEYLNPGGQGVGGPWLASPNQTTHNPPQALFNIAGDTTGANANASWVVYTGATQPVPAKASAKRKGASKK